MKTDGTPPVDLDGFRETMREAGIEEVVEEVLQEYLMSAPDVFARLEVAVAAQDLQAIMAQAHSLKSASASIHARRLAELLREVEAVALQGDLRAAVTGFERLEPEYRAVVSFLGDRLSGA